MEPTATTAPSLPRSIEEIRAEFPILAREVHGQPLAYLDNGATAQKPLAVIDTLDRYWREHNANVHRGVHTLSEEATSLYEEARGTVASHLGADRREVVFVRNATEALNLVAYSWGRTNLSAGDRIVVTEMEHHSNVVPWYQVAQERDADLDWAPIDDEGRLDLEALSAAARARPEARLRRPRLERARHDQPDPGDRPDGPRRGRAAGRRRRTGRAEARARHGRARRGLLRDHRPQDVRADRRSARSSAAASCSRRCRPSSGAAR